MPNEVQGRYQMLWDCSFCGSEKLLGLDHKHCPACGAPQDPARRYFPAEGEEIAVADHPYHGADRVCPACSTPNAAIAKFCTGCGSPLDEAEAAGRRDDITTAAGARFGGESASDADAEAKQKALADKQARIQAASGQAAPPPDEPDGGGGSAPGKGRLVLGCVVLLLIAAAIFCGVALLWKKEATVTVTGHTWQRTIEVEAKKQVTESAWKEDVPSGARNLSCTKEQQSTKKIKDGETCNTVRKDMGDGTYKKVKECKPNYKEEPVYGQKCRYTVEKWVTDRTAKASGDSPSDKIAWPDPKLSLGQREGSRSESFVVKFRSNDGDDLTCSTSQSRWASLKQGSSWTARVGVLTDSVDCDALTPK